MCWISTDGWLSLLPRDKTNSITSGSRNNKPVDNMSPCSDAGIYGRKNDYLFNSFGKVRNSIKMMCPFVRWWSFFSCRWRSNFPLVGRFQAWTLGPLICPATNVGESTAAAVIPGLRGVAASSGSIDREFVVTRRRVWIANEAASDRRTDRWTDGRAQHYRASYMRRLPIESGIVADTTSTSCCTLTELRTPHAASPHSPAPSSATPFSTGMCKGGAPMVVSSWASTDRRERFVPMLLLLLLLEMRDNQRQAAMTTAVVYLGIVSQSACGIRAASYPSTASDENADMDLRKKPTKISVSGATETRQWRQRHGTNARNSLAAKPITGQYVAVADTLCSLITSIPWSKMHDPFYQSVCSPFHTLSMCLRMRNVKLVTVFELKSYARA